MEPKEVLHYQITGRLGQGAMGEVFRATDRRLGREVALKMLPVDLAGDAASQRRLLREAQAASALNHPGIVTLYDIASVDDHTFLVMELVSGEPFSELARRGIPWQRAVELVASVAGALAAAHARGILHRDIKSDNLMVTPSGQTKVLDFGVAKLRGPRAADDDLPDAPLPRQRGDDAPPSSRLTQLGQVVGTPAYLAPECYDGNADARSEVFALGVVLYELLTGVRPFDRATTLETATAIHFDEPEPPSRCAPERALPEPVDALVARALAKQPADRFPDMAALEAALRQTLAPPSSAWRRRWPWLAGVAGAAAALALGVPVAWLALARGEARDPVIEVTASRRLTFDLGCEEYPRFHPDGRRIVYDGVVDGDYELSMLDLDSGASRRLTSSPGWDYAAALSPDGEHVAFVHEDPAGRTLRVLALDGGEPRDLGAIAGYPAWARDGALLYGDGSGRVVRRALDGGGETVLGQLPAGARLYHLIEVGDHGVALLWWTSSEADATALGEMARDGSVRILEQASTDYEGGLAASRDGGGFYATRKGVAERNQLLYRAWGTGRATVVPGGLSPAAGIDVAPDSRRLVFSTCFERQHVARITANGQVVELAGGNWQDTNPQIVDAKRLLVTSNRTGQQHGWLLDLGGAEPRSVTPPDALGASPSPDGALVVYAASGGRGGLMIVPMAGGEARALTSDPSDTAPMFTRDGADVVFERTAASGETSIFVVPAAGGEPRAIALGSQPAASPSDDTIAFVTAADDGGARQVMLTGRSGGLVRAVPRLERAAWQRPRFSADGKRLVVVRGFQQIVAVTLDGSEAPATIWTATTGSVSAAEFARDGDGVIAAVASYDGDLWLAEGTFP